MTFATLKDFDAQDKTVLVRLDLNVPMSDGKITDATRIERALPTLKTLSSAGAKVAVLSHFGRPKGKNVPEMSLAPVAHKVAEMLGQPVAFVPDCVGTDAKRIVGTLASGQIAVLENTRFHAGEEKNDADFSQALAQLGDAYVNDAFSACHRAHASTVGITQHLPSFAGLALQAELEHLTKALMAPQRPVAAMVGGAKVSSKIAVLENLIPKIDHLIIGGGMANTFLAAQGYDVAQSLCEHDLTDTALRVMAAAKDQDTAIHLPVDGVAAEAFAENAPHVICDVGAVPADSMLLDIGPKTIARYQAILSQCNTVVWNGPAGAFEIAPFDQGTVALAQAVANGTAVSVAGGGDTVAALEHAQVLDQFTYVSTAGGAFLEWLEGKYLPGVTALNG